MSYKNHMIDGKAVDLLGQEIHEGDMVAFSRRTTITVFGEITKITYMRDQQKLRDDERHLATRVNVTVCPIKQTDGRAGQSNQMGVEPTRLIKLPAFYGRFAVNA